MSLKFQGSMTALVTPFRGGKIDEKAFRLLVDRQILAGTDVLVPCGTTGEAPTLSAAEQSLLITMTVEQAAGKIPVLAGAGANATETAIVLARQAKKAKADGILVVTPYYNKPTQEGLFQHYEAIAKAVDLPIVLYNVPGRTGVSLETATVLRLAAIDTIVGIKEASGNLEAIQKLIREAPKNFAVYSGDDALNAQIYALGGQGTISVTANIVPDRVKEAWKSLKLQKSLEPLNKILFIETNPIPIKTALSLMGKCAEEFRLPLCPMQPKNKEELKKILIQEGLI